MLRARADLPPECCKHSQRIENTPVKEDLDSAVPPEQWFSPRRGRRLKRQALTVTSREREGGACAFGNARRLYTIIRDDLEGLTLYWLHGTRIPKCLSRFS
jgi:hypothetical protein